MRDLSTAELPDGANRGGMPSSTTFVSPGGRNTAVIVRKRVTDFVLKPLPSQGTLGPWGAALERTMGGHIPGLAEILRQLERLLSKPSKVATKVQGKILFIDLSEVTAVEAQGNYVLLRKQTDCYRTRASIATLAEKLRPCGFIRIHRSVLVNASCVQEIQCCTTGEYLLRVKGGKEYTVSRTYKENLKSLAQFWIGADALVD